MPGAASANPSETAEASVAAALPSLISQEQTHMPTFISLVSPIATLLDNAKQYASKQISFPTTRPASDCTV